MPYAVDRNPASAQGIEPVNPLRAMRGWLDATERQARKKNVEVGALFTARLAPDMTDFISQVRRASDCTKDASAWLSGTTPPVFGDGEQTIDDLRARIDKTRWRSVRASTEAFSRMPASRG
jgi:hypothetical protein